MKTAFFYYVNTSLLWRGIKRDFVLFLLWISSTFLFSQETKKGEVYYYARRTLDTMTSESMYGRGYFMDGDKIAANFIKTEFQKFGLLPLTKNYFQFFSFPINTFPYDNIINFDNNELQAGVDFIIDAHSSSFKGKYKTVFADNALLMQKRRFKRFLKQDFTNKIIVINDTIKQDKQLQDLLANKIKAKAIVIYKDKLTWSTTQQTIDYPIIEALRKSNQKIPNEVSIEIENKFISEYPSQNVISYVKGSVYPDSFIVFSAHYDHLGHMGLDIYFPGANDNASGCAMLLNLAKYYSMPEHQPKCSIAFIAFGGEEVGLLGSKYFVEHPLFPLRNIKFLLNMDIMGTGEEGITVVNGTLFKNEFEKLKEINSTNHFIKDVKIRGKAANSDHYYFSEAGVKAFFIYTLGGIKAYHDIYDRAETLPLNEFENIFSLINNFTNYLQQ